MRMTSLDRHLAFAYTRLEKRVGRFWAEMFKSEPQNRRMSNFESTRGGQVSKGGFAPLNLSF
jgi:hypothetical protein